MLRTHRPVVGVSVKELLLRCDVWSVPAREQLEMLTDHTYKPDVGVSVRRHMTETLLSRSTFSTFSASSFPVQSSIIKSVE